MSMRIEVPKVRLHMLLVISSKLGMLSQLFSSSLKLYKIGGTCLIMSPVCFMYLVERYLMVLSFFDRCFLTTKTTSAEWLIFQVGRPCSTSNSAAGMHVSEESGDRCRVEESSCTGETCSKGKKPASEATLNSKLQTENKFMKKQE
ncbi:hypothetical protein V6N13_115646 [Hibiscus sabdariffa]|uniref:Uncharacterized protein n=1 Tax=Hibiscus sabdariffa TaxID=183260 RepID=A0ABR2CSU1_9ROSI